MENKYAFKKGYGLLRAIDQTKVRDEIKEALKLATNNGFYDRRKGKVIPSVAEAESIEDIFKKYGITANNIWGE